MYMVELSGQIVSQYIYMCMEYQSNTTNYVISIDMIEISDSKNHHL